MKRFVLLGLLATTLVTACSEKGSTSKTFHSSQLVGTHVDTLKTPLSHRTTQAKTSESELPITSEVSRKLQTSSQGQSDLIVQNNRAYYDELFEWSGIWDTSYGEMMLDQEPFDGTEKLPRVVGAYDTDEGRIDARLYDGALEGIWVETSSAQKCSTQKLGSYYWGGIYFQKIDADNFKGYWTYCDQQVGPRSTQGAKKWSGKRRTETASYTPSPQQTQPSRYSPSFRGNWKTSEGNMTLAWADHVTVTGTYSQDNGRIIGNVDDRRVLNGYWIEDGSSQRCNTAKDGSYYWGRVQFRLNADETEFTGKWSYCNAVPTSAWNGQRS